MKTIPAMMVNQCEDDEGEFPADFSKYMHRELQWSRLSPLPFTDALWERIGWVFWSREPDPPPPPRLPRDNSSASVPDALSSPKVEEKIRHALQKIILDPRFTDSLVQYWAATTTLEGRTLLTTRNQPFAIGNTPRNGSTRGKLCEYRLRSKEYQFYVDGGKSEEEQQQLGVLGRVFLHKLPESSPHVEYYTTREYPQRDLALRCEVEASWALPVFEDSGHICVGVLELVSSGYSPVWWIARKFVDHLYDVFKELGLQCFDEYKHYHKRFRDKNEACKAAFNELKMMLGSVCKTHMLPLALTWVPCNACDDLSRGQLLSEDVEYYDSKSGKHFYFLEVHKGAHLRKGRVAGSVLSFPNLLYCSNITQFNIAEYPSVHFARKCGLSGWFTICLQSSYTGNDMYVLEFFLPTSSKDGENTRTLLSMILETMKESSKTFKLASGLELGEELSVKVIDFQNGKRVHSVQMIQATRYLPSVQPSKNGFTVHMGPPGQPSMDAINNGMNVGGAERIQIGGVTLQLDSLDQPSMDAINNGMNAISAERNYIDVSSSEGGGTIQMQEREPKKSGVRIKILLEDIIQYSELTRVEAAKKLEVSISTLKRVCRDNGIHRWPPRNIKKIRPSRLLRIDQERIPLLSSSLLSNKPSTSVPHMKPRDTVSQDANMVTLRAKYVNDLTIKFQLSLSSGLVELQQQVAKRLNLEAGTYRVKYKDEEGELILIACDEDFKDYLNTTRSLGFTSMMVFLEPM